MRGAFPAALACFCLLAACGGDNGGSAEDFRAQADAVCADYGPRIAAVPPPLEDVDEWAAIAGDIGDLMEAAVNALRGLEPPEGLASDYGEWIALREEVLAQARALQQSGAAHDVEAVATALASAQQKESEAAELAGELGLADCAVSESSFE